MKVRELGKFIRDQRGAARLSLRKLSKLAGVSNPYLSQIERGLRRPSAEILQAIARALSISAETLYVKAGILDERVGDIDLATAIRRDATISEKQKQVLLEVYQSFRHDRDAGRRTEPGKAPVKAPRARAKAPGSRPASTTRRRSVAAARRAPSKPSAKRARSSG